MQNRILHVFLFFKKNYLFILLGIIVGFLFFSHKRRRKKEREIKRIQLKTLN